MASVISVPSTGISGLVPVGWSLLSALMTNITITRQISVNAGLKYVNRTRTETHSSGTEKPVSVNANGLVREKMGTSSTAIQKSAISSADHETAIRTTCIGTASFATACAKTRPVKMDLIGTHRHASASVPSQLMITRAQQQSTSMRIAAAADRATRCLVQKGNSSTLTCASASVFQSAVMLTTKHGLIKLATVFEQVVLKSVPVTKS